MLPSVLQATSASTSVVYDEALSLHAFALQPIASSCTLRRHRYRGRRNTQYLVPGHGFQGGDFHPTDKAELRSAHLQQNPFVWLGRHRHLSKDYEYLPETSEAFIYLAMSRLMLRRLAS